MSGGSLATCDRFLAEIASGNIRSGYVLVGDETFLVEQCRSGAAALLIHGDNAKFALHELSLQDKSIYDILDLARTPSLMVPFQIIFVRGLKALYGRAPRKPEFEAIDDYFRRPNPQVLLIFVADYLHIPADVRKIEVQDKERFDRLRETLGTWCGLVELAKVSEADATEWLVLEAAQRSVRIDKEAARELVDALGADMMMIASELDKLSIFVTAPERKATGETAEILMEDIETMVLAAKQRSIYELTDAISLKSQSRALLLLHGLLNATSTGDEGAIGHLYVLARTFRQMLVLHQQRVRDPRGVWTALWPGFRMPPFAADAVVRQAQRYDRSSDLTRALRLISRADLELRSSPSSKTLVLERLILALTSGSQIGGSSHAVRYGAVSTRP